MVIEDIGHEPGPVGLMHRPASLRLPTDGLIEIVFVDVLIDLGFVSVGWAAGRCDLRRLGGFADVVENFPHGLGFGDKSDNPHGGATGRTFSARGGKPEM